MLQLPITELDVRPGRVLTWRLGDAPERRTPGVVSYNQEDQLATVRALREAADPAVAPESLACQPVITFEIRRPPDPRALEAALLHFVRRHDALRSSFRPGTAGAAGGATCEVTDARDAVLDYRDLGRPDSPAALRTVLDALFKEIDVLAGRLFVLAAVVREGSATVYLAFDHSVYDGLSAAVAVHDVATAYAAYARGAEPDLPPAESHVSFSRDQRRRMATLHAGDGRLEYWKQCMTPDGGLCPPFPLDLGLAPGEVRPAVIRTDRLLTETGTRALYERSRAVGGGIFAAFLAALGIWVRDAGGPDTFSGFMPVGARGRGPYEHAMGWFANPVPVRFSVAADRDRAAIIAGIRAAYTTAAQHAHVPFMLARRLLTAAHAPHEGTASPHGSATVPREGATVPHGGATVPSIPCAFSYIDYTRSPGAAQHAAWRARHHLRLSHCNGLCFWLHRTATGLYVYLAYPDTPEAASVMSGLRPALVRTLRDMAASPAGL